jgi:endonuclease/exonuclease/phosphatase family metal-dependent hydrolase
MIICPATLRSSAHRALSRCCGGGAAVWMAFTAVLATRRAVSLATLLLAATVASTGCAPLGQTPGHPEDSGIPVRVMSFNIAAGHGDLPRIAEVIRESGAEIVGLQEVDVHWGARSGFVDQATWLAEALGMQVFFAPIYTFPGAEGRPQDRQFGLAILSRHPITESTNHLLSRLSTQSDVPVPVPHPGFPQARIEIGGRSVQVFNTHLDYRSDPVARKLQIGEMLRIIAEEHRPVLLLGDLNAEPGDPELEPLLERLRDVWPSADDGFTYPSGSPVKRIDYILASPHFTIDTVAVLSTDASDHRPVVADLRLRRDR